MKHIHRVLYFSTNIVFFDDSESYVDRTVECLETFIKNNKELELDGICINTDYTERLIYNSPENTNVYVYSYDGTDSVIKDKEADVLLHQFFNPQTLQGCVFFYDRPKFGEIMEKVEILRTLEYCAMYIGEMDITVYIDENTGRRIAYVEIGSESG